MSTPSQPLVQPPQGVVVVQARQVYGLRIPNQEAAVLTRKVIHMSIALMFMQLTFSLYNAYNLGQTYFLGGGLIGLLVPFCGYYGAKYRQRGMVIAFSMCNCLTAVCLPVTVGAIAYVCHWLSSNFTMLCPNGSEGMPVWPNNIANVTENGHPITCEELDDIVQAIPSIYAVLIPIGVLSTLFACLSCTWGFRLANTQYFTVPVTSFTSGAVATVAQPAVSFQPPSAYSQPAVVDATVVTMQQDKTVPSVAHY